MVNKKRIYQVYCGRWQAANWRDHPGEVLCRLAEFDWLGLRHRLDLTHIYLLGLWDVGERIMVQEEHGVDLTGGVRCPSAFALVNHTQVWPRLGSLADLIRLIKVIHEAGLLVYVDFVANHTGLDHAWVHGHSDWYKQHDGRLQTAFSGDVVELNYETTAVNRAMEAVALTLADYGVDGFRCDMAHLVPVAFWQRTIRAVRGKYPSFSFIAEAYGQSVFDHTNEDVLIHAGFDGVYDGALYQNLRQLQFGEHLDWLVGHANYVLKQHKTFLVHYLSNHDDAYPLSKTSFVPLLCLLLALPDSVLLYNGSDSGYTGRLAHHIFEELPQEYVDGTGMPETLRQWIQLVRSPGFILEGIEQLGSHAISLVWSTATGRGATTLRLDTGAVVTERCYV